MAIEKSNEAGKEYEYSDDFKVIHGIGPGIENRLYKAGIYRYDQLAALSPEEIVSAIGPIVGLTVERITNQHWIDQAKKRVPPAQTPVQPINQTPDARVGRQHYATFTVELLLGEENTVRRTKLVHIQSELEETWAGWDEARLIGFVTRSAQVPVQADIEPGENKGVSLEKNEAIKHTAPPQVTGSPRMRDLAFISPTSGSQRRIVAQGQPFDIKMTLDFSEVQAGVQAGAENPLPYRLMAYAKALGKGDRQVIGSSEGSIQPGELTTLQLKSDGLPEGTYRLAFDFSASTPSSARPQPDLSAVLDGGLIKVY